jgi:hypothetical protein
MFMLSVVFKITKPHFVFVQVKLLNRSIIGEPHLRHSPDGFLSGIGSSGPSWGRSINLTAESFFIVDWFARFFILLSL